MSANDLLDRLKVNSPCSADWSSMTGNDRVRFCEHCELKVHNVSEMSHNQAARLVAFSKGRLCVRYHLNPAGDLITRDVPSKLHQIGRRVSRIAAGAFSATLSLSSPVTIALAEPNAGPTYSRQLPRSADGNTGAVVVGTITDQNGALIPGATVSLSNMQTGAKLYASTNDSGEYRFEELPHATYLVHIEAPGFDAVDAGNVFVQPNGEARVDQILSVAHIEAEVEIQSPVVYALQGIVAVASAADPFVRTAQRDDLEEMQALIAEADVNLRDKETRTTALEYAVGNGNREMVQLLLSKGADVNTRNEEKQTPLMMLGEEATSDLVWDLLNAGAKVNEEDEDGNTPLISVADINNLEALKTLLEGGADINARNKKGQTALMRAASENLINNVRALVLAGADINAKDSDGWTAFSYASGNGHRGVMRFLRSRGAFEPAKAEPEEEKPEK